MKKLMALLLASMLLFPAAALADAITYRYTVNIDQDYYQQTLLQSVQMDFASAAEVEETVGVISNVVCGIVNASAFTVTTQDDGIRLAWEMQDAEVADLLITWTDDALLMSTSLLPDTVLELPLTEAIAAFGEVNWAEIAAAMDSEWTSWYLSRDIEIDVVGQYAGAAYEGANERIIIRFDDADVALLVDGLMMIIEDSDSLYSLLDRQAVQASIDDMRRFNYEAAMTNAYDYELIIAYNSDLMTDEFVGMSLNVREGDREAWSVSFGVDEHDNVKIIASFNVDGNTNYFAFTQDSVEQNNERTVTTEMGIWQALEGVSYAEASQDPAKAVFYTKSVEVTRTVGSASHYRLEREVDSFAMVNGVEGEHAYGKVTEDFAAQPFRHEITEFISFGDQDNVMSAHFLGTAGEAYTHPAGAQHVSVIELAADEDLQDELNKRFEEGAQTFAIMLFKQVPTEMLIQLMRFGM